MQPKRAVLLLRASCCSSVSYWNRLLWHMLRISWSHPNSTADVFTRAFYLSSTGSLWRNTMVTSQNLLPWRMRVNIPASVCKMKYSYLLEKTQMDCMILSVDEFPSLPMPSLWTGAILRLLERVLFIPWWEDMACSLFFSSVVLRHVKFAYYSCAKRVRRNARYITWILN